MTSTDASTVTSFWRTAVNLAARRQRLIADLSRRQLAGCLITSDEDRTWLSGFGAASHDTVPVAVLLLGQDHQLLLTSANNVDWAASEAPGLEVVEWKRPWWSTLGKLLYDLDWPTMGYQGDHLSVTAYTTLMDAFDANRAFDDLDDATVELRAVKDDGEIRTLRRAVEITDAAFHDATTGLDAGMTERDLARSLDEAMRRHGASEPGFPTIVASGPNAARPHHAPTNRLIRAGEPVIIDMGARYDGYTADLTRTVWVGEPDARLAEIYPVVERANAAAQSAVRSGVSGLEVDATARQVITDAGYGDAFLHGLGHGVGLAVHERPSAGQQSVDTLEAGQTLTIEPGIYLPGWGGVRIEDMGVVTADGFDCLTAARKADLT